MSIFLFLALVLPLFVGTIVGADAPTDLAGFPKCAQTCISNNHGGCALLDMECMCNNQVPTIFSCMQGSCNAEDQAATLRFAQELCDQVGATSTAKVSGAAKTGATTLSTVTSTPTGFAEATSSLSPSSSSSSSSVASPKSGLSTGATAGIGVGAMLGAMAVAAGGFFVWQRKRARDVEELPGSAAREVGLEYTLPPEYGQKGVEVVDGVHIIHHEVDGVQWMELEAKEATRYLR
ncbi:hypothetical protein PMIN04_010561 [Paraphaeosphaeria minitans]